MKKCFVITGYGIKTDPITGKQFDLDKLFKNAIKPVFESQGYACHRAIDLNTSGAIDNVMFENILHADFVVVDLTTFNANVMYELGVRHVLRPYSTLLVCESESMNKIPFNIKKLTIHSYEHLGKGIDYEEIKRMEDLIKNLVVNLEASKTQDSPVYDSIQGLKVEYTAPPEQMIRTLEQNFRHSEGSLSSLIERGEEALTNADYAHAKSEFQKALGLSPNDPYLIKRLALSTYKNDDSQQGLNQALSLLNQLNLNIENDTETMGLMGAVHKRLYSLTNDPDHLDRSISYYRKGYVLHDDHYNGVNYAQMNDMKLALETDSNVQKRLKSNTENIRAHVVQIVDENLDNPEIKSDEKAWLKLTKAEVMADMGDFAYMKAIINSPDEHGINIQQLNSIQEQIELKDWKNHF